MTEIDFDETAYAEIAPGFIRRVVRNLMSNLADKGLIDLETELTEDEANLVFDLALGVFVQFEDMRGHRHGNLRYPAAVGFTVNTLDGTAVHKPEKLLSTRKRTVLHGGLNGEVIRNVFEDLRTA